ncbi:hypothetical protein D3C81_1387000 [compost metagenome]
MLEWHYSVTHTETKEKFILASDETNNFYLIPFKHKELNEVIIPFENPKNLDLLKDLNQYTHYKGNVYTTFFTALHIDTNEKFVIYTKEEDQLHSIYWARPYDMFHNYKTLKDGTRVKRFTLIESK